MRAHTAAPAQPIEPPLHGLTDATPLAAALAVALIASTTLGIALAALLRRRKQSWTFALLVVPASVLAIAASLAIAPSPAATAAIATAAVALPSAAIHRGLHDRLQDRRAGGDRELRAKEMRGPLDPLRRRIAERPGRRDQTNDIPIGRTNRSELATIRRGTPASGSHVLIPGATGAGKTTTLAALLTEYVIRSGFGAIVLEAKVDGALRQAAASAAAAENKPFHLISPGGPSAYDPLADGSVDERSERLIAVEDWGSADADFYRQAASPFLRLVIRALDSVQIDQAKKSNGSSRPDTTLRTVASACAPDRLENIAEHISDPDLVDEIAAHVQALGTDERRAVAGLRARLLNLADSGFARDWLDPARASKQGIPLITIREALRRREVVYLRFDTDRTGNVGRAIAQMALLDLGAAASSMMGNGAGTFVASDEFGALEASAVERLFARGRAAGISVALGTQTIADLGQAGPAVAERIGGTVESIVCHRIGAQRDAEWIAQAIGTVPDWDTTVRTDGLGLPTNEGTRTRGHRFEVHPSALQRLNPGEAYVARLDKSTKDRSKRVRVVPPWERLAGSEPSPPGGEMREQSALSASNGARPRRESAAP
jgi:hypothetical protein